MIKALFFDLDGTLLNSDKAITQSARAALEACIDKGIKLFVATARPPLLDRMLLWDKQTLSLFDGGLYHNGGCIVYGRHKHYLPISGDTLKAIILAVLSYDGVNIALQLEGERHAFRFPLGCKDYKGWGIDAQTTLALSKADAYRAIKILLFHGNLIDEVKPIDQGLITGIAEICRDRAQFYLTDNGGCIQVMEKGVNKAGGIETIRKLAGLQCDEIAVFGDDLNDVEMLSAYSYSVAMGNANDMVQKAARYVTLNNDDDGICHALHHILKVI